MFSFVFHSIDGALCQYSYAYSRVSAVAINRLNHYFYQIIIHKSMI